MSKLFKALVRAVNEHVNPEDAFELKAFRDSVTESKKIEAVRNFDPGVVDARFWVLMKEAPQLRGLGPSDRAEFMSKLEGLAKFLHEKVA